MSVQAITWALAQMVKPSGRKFTLVALANYSDGEGACFPGQKKLAMDTSLSERSVWKYLRDLEAEGYITRCHRQRSDGSRTSDEYRLNIQLAPVAVRASTQLAPGSEPTRTGREAILEPSEEPSEKNPPLESPPLEIIDAEPTAEQSFETWWALYPKKVDRKLAEKAYLGILKRRDATVPELYAGLRAYAAFLDAERWESRHIKGPAAWLNAERWKDDLTVRKRTSDYDLIMSGVRNGGDDGNNGAGENSGDLPAGQLGPPDAQPRRGTGGLRRL